MPEDLDKLPNLAELLTHSSAKWREFPADVLPLPVAEMDFPVAAPIRAKLLAMVANSDLGYLGPIPELGLGFQKFAASRWSWEVDPLQVRVAADVGVAVVEILRRFTKPGDLTLINSPIYHNYFNWVTETELKIVDVPLTRTGDENQNPWELDWDGVEKAYASGIKVHFIVNPHNPLGRLYAKQELLRLVGLAKKYDVLIISNELHAPLTYVKENFTPILTLGQDAQAVSIVVTAASKGWNIAGLKCAIIVTQNDAMNEKLKALPPALHWRASLLGGFATAVAFAEGEPWLDAVLVQLDHNRHLLKDLLSAKLPSVRYHLPHASYLAWLDLTALNLGENPSATLLARGKVAFNAGHTFGQQSSQYVRLNFATSPEILTEAIERIAQAL